MNIRIEFWHRLQIWSGFDYGAKSALRAVLTLASLIAGLTTPLVAEEVLISSAPVGRSGGRLVVALRAEPKTLNPIFAADAPSLAVIRRTVGDLVHINRWSQLTEAAVAKTWTVSPDGRTIRLRLRQGLRFSDGPSRQRG